MITDKYKKTLLLLNKYKFDEEGFKKAYLEEFPPKEPDFKGSSEIEITEYLSETMSFHINTEILMNMIWLGKDDFLKGLREDKLKRILGE